MSSQPMMLRVSCTSGEKFILMTYKGSSLKDLRKSIENEFFSKYSFQGIRKAQVMAISDLDDYLIHQSLHGLLNVGDVFFNGDTIKVQLSFSYEKEKNIEKMNESLEIDSEEELSSDEEDIKITPKRPQITSKALSPSFFERVSSDEEDKLETSESDNEIQEDSIQEEEENQEKEVENQERMEEEEKEEEKQMDSNFGGKITNKIRQYLVDFEKGKTLKEIIEGLDEKTKNHLKGKETTLLSYFKTSEDYKLNGNIVLLSPKFFKTKMEIIQLLNSILSKNSLTLIEEIYPKLSQDDKKFIGSYYGYLKTFFKKHPNHFEIILESVKKK